MRHYNSWFILVNGNRLLTNGEANLEKHSTSLLKALLISFQLVHSISLALVPMLILVHLCAIYLLNLLSCVAKQPPQLSTIEI